MSVAGWLDAMHSSYPPAHRLVWMCLESHANSARQWQITDQEIAAEMHLGINTVSRAIRDLERDAIIHAKRRKRQPTIYTMQRTYPPSKGKLNGHFGGSSDDLTPQDGGSTGPLTPQNGESSGELTPQNVHSTTQQQAELTPQNGESSGELTPQNGGTKTPTESNREERGVAVAPVAPVNRRALTDAQFDTFWKGYPRKQAKAAARKALAALLKAGTPFDEVMAGLKRHTFTADREFIPHASTWLRGRRWEDEPLPKKRGVWDWADHLFDNPGPASRSDDDWDGTTIDGEVSSAPTYTH